MTQRFNRSFEETFQKDTKAKGLSLYFVGFVLLDILCDPSPLANDDISNAVVNRTRRHYRDNRTIQVDCAIAVRVSPTSDLLKLLFLPAGAYRESVLPREPLVLYYMSSIISDTAFNEPKHCAHPTGDICFTNHGATRQSTYVRSQPKG